MPAGVLAELSRPWVLRWRRVGSTLRYTTWEKIGLRDNPTSREGPKGGAGSQAKPLDEQCWRGPRSQKRVPERCEIEESASPLANAEAAGGAAASDTDLPARKTPTKTITKDEAFPPSSLILYVARVPSPLHLSQASIAEEPEP